MKAYVALSPTGYVLLGNCEREAYRTIFKFFDKVRELGAGAGAGGDEVFYEGERERQMRCLLRPKKYAAGAGMRAAPTDEDAEGMFHTFMTTDGGGYVMGS